MKDVDRNKQFKRVTGKLKLKSRSEMLETLIVFSFLFGILFPARILFVRLVGDSWIGSFGILTLIYVILIILIKKNKLGKFGKMIARQLFKIHKGKRKYFVYTNIIIATLFFGTVVFGMETAKAYYSYEVNMVLNHMETKSLVSPQDAERYVKTEFPKLSPNNILSSLITLIELPFTNYDLFIIVWGVADKMTDGWFLNLSIILLAEELEVVGFLIAIKFIIKEDYFTQKTV